MLLGTGFLEAHMYPTEPTEHRLTRRGARRLLAAGMLSLAALALTVPARADAASFLGAQTRAPGERAMYATLGIPDAELGATFGLNSLTDVTPRLRLQYGRGTELGGAGLAVGAGVRFQVARLAGWTIALTAEPEVSLHVGARNSPMVVSGSSANTLAFGVGVPGVVADRALNHGVRFIAGVRAPITVYALPGWTLNVAVFGQVGAEFLLGDDLVMLALVDVGADLYGPGAATGSALFFRSRVGLGWLF